MLRLKRYINEGPDQLRLNMRNTFIYVKVAFTEKGQSERLNVERPDKMIDFRPISIFKSGPFLVMMVH